jgi:hypothetical protein
VPLETGRELHSNGSVQQLARVSAIWMATDVEMSRPSRTRGHLLREGRTIHAEASKKLTCLVLPWSRPVALNPRLS